jgi:AcrR family transcriptional regulator
VSEQNTRRRDSAATRQALFDAAAELFAERGYRRTTVRDIAARAGANQALLFRYFGSKEELFAAVTSARDAILEQRDPHKFFTQLLDGLLDPESPKQRDQALLLSVRSLGTDGEASAVTRDVVAGYAQVLTELSDEPDAELRAHLLLACMFGVGLMRGLAQHQPIEHADADHLRQLLRPLARTLLDKIDN